MSMLDLGIDLEHYPDVVIERLIIEGKYPDEKERLWILYNRVL